MAINILSNRGEDNNHYNFLMEYSKKADKIIIVSPFLAKNMVQIISEMSTIKYIELYTNLDGYGMAADVLPVVCRIYEYCNKKGISVLVKCNNHLHGKVYLLYKGNEERGCIITSGNFTESGLKSNHEYGVFLDNESMQRELLKQIYSLDCLELSYKEASNLELKADEFVKKYLSKKLPVFKASDYIEKRIILPDNCRFFLKVLGGKERPIVKGYTIIKDNEIGFNERQKPSHILKGDILICHGREVGNVLGMCKVSDGKLKEKVAFKGDRWNLKLATSCISEDIGYL